MSVSAPAAERDNPPAGVSSAARRLRLGVPRRAWARVLLGLAGLVAIAIPVSSWFLSSLLLDPHDNLVGSRLKVLSIGPGEVTLARTAGSMRPGTYGLDWTGGSATITAITRIGPDAVTRKLSALSGRLAPGTDADLNDAVWNGNPSSALGIPYAEVSYPDPLGPMPAWVVGGRGATWVMFVHGIDGNRTGGLRPLITLHALDIPTMLISYRNDSGAPSSPDHLIHLGMTEWQDLDAATRWALARGAKHFILYGDSMGGAIVTRYMHESPRARDVVAMVLDSPVLDWRSVIAHVLSTVHLPFLSLPLRTTISLRTGMDWNSMDEVRRAHQFHVPILLFQGAADPLVPAIDSERFAAALPRLTTYVPVAKAGHIESWNIDPTSYAGHLRAFLAPLLRLRIRG